MSSFPPFGGAPYKLPDIKYYLRLLASQYQNSPKLKAWIQVILQPLVDAGVTLGEFVNAFDLDAAVGPQLDILGLIIGVSRTVPFVPSNNVSPVLNDNTYRILLKATVGANQWNGSQTSLFKIWQTLFPGGTIIIIDNQNMTADVTLVGSFTSIIQDLIQHDMIVPRPQGVLYNYIFPKLPMFGLDIGQGIYIAGLDAGFLV